MSLQFSDIVCIVVRCVSQTTISIFDIIYILWKKAYSVDYYRAFFTDLYQQSTTHWLPYIKSGPKD